MKISGQRDYRVNLESVAITDIVLNMFIFFFISFSLLYTFSPYNVQKIEVKLPEAPHTAPAKNIDQACITITEKGLTYLGNKPVTRNELKTRIGIMYKNNSSMSVILYADKLAKFKDIVSVLDTLTEVGIKNLNIAAITKN